MIYKTLLRRLKIEQHEPDWFFNIVLGSTVHITPTRGRLEAIVLNHMNSGYANQYIFKQRYINIIVFPFLITNSSQILPEEKLKSSCSS